MYSFDILYSSVYPVRQQYQHHVIYLIRDSQATHIEEMLSAKYTEAFMEYIFRIH